MYIRISSNGIIKEFSSDLLSIFKKTRDKVLGKSFIKLVKNDTDKLIIGARFLKIKTSYGQGEKVYKYITNGVPVWIKWHFIRSESNDLIVIGDNITCKVKFKPIIEKQNKILRQQNKNMMDSLCYAKHIQNALLPSNKIMDAFGGSFIIYWPKDIVSGDFYWLHKLDNIITTISIDCTGHGVPGALMTVLVNSLLNEIIKTNKVYHPHEIMELLDFNLQNSLNANKNKLNDGLDMSICVLNLKTGVLKFSGAQQNLIVTNKDGIKKMKGGKFPIGYFPYKKKIMETFEIEFVKGDRFYLNSDGVTDQFGGAKSKKFGSKKLLSLLESTCHLDMKKQKELLEETLVKWKGEEEQVDDLLLMGFEY
ncbi:MAG: SpoIIE family protein phosphatase [Flavobacteriales bacterium]|nr:SpoIIE family protein phosphatase [Flavobacteriales bacterium]